MRACGLMAVLLLVPAWLAAQGLDSEQNLEVVRAELAVLAHAIDAGDTLQARRQSSERRQRLVSIRAQARECTSQRLANLESLGARRAALGEPACPEDPEVDALRRQLAADITSNEKRRAACEQIVQAAQDLLDRIGARQQAALVARLFAQGPSTPGILVDAIAQPREWSRLVSGFLTAGSGWERLGPNRRGSVLEFELRCFIRQIDRIYDVTHDLNMAIDRAFREAGITIPFPQRDVHVRTLPETGSAQDT